MIFLTALIFLLLPNIILTIYTSTNSTIFFEAFKEKFKKSYKNSKEEESRFKAFVNNLNAVDKLNENTTDTVTFFILSRYADLDPNEIKEKYAVNIKPYHTINNKTEAEFMGRQKGRELNTSQLFNLENANELYEDFLKRFNKKNYTKKERTIHFYRFVKTLVEINNRLLEGNETLALEEDADIIKEPNEYYY